MKKLIILFALSAILFIPLKSQVTLTTAVDFTANDVNGNSIHLFGLLDAGKYVALEFWATWWSTCPAVATTTNQAYEYFGCNTGDVIFIGINDDTNNAGVIAWDNTNGVDYTNISGTSGGSAIHNSYSPTALPTLILIAPDKSIVEHDIWPISSSANIISPLLGHGLTQTSCSSSAPKPYSSSKKSEMNDFIYPNPTNGIINIKASGFDKADIYDVTGNLVSSIILTSDIIDLSHLQNGMYIVELVNESRKINQKVMINK